VIATTETLLPDAAVYARGFFEKYLRTERSRELALLAAAILFGLAWGALVAIGGIGAALACVSLVACVCCMLDFRSGVTLLILMMPISSSVLFPHAMFGLTGINPFNLLLVMTFGIFLMNSLGTGTMRGFMPRYLWWLYVAPFLMGGIVGMQHIDEIPRLFKASEMIYFDGPMGYWRDMILKPLGFVIYAMLIAAAVGRSQRPERFVTPMLLSVYVMALLAIGFVIESGAHLSDLAGVYARQFFSALGMHANDLGRLYAVAYALLLFTWDRTSRVSLKMLLFTAMVMVTIALVLTFSRGAFMGFVIVNLIYLASRRTMKTLVMAAIAVPLGFMLAPGAFWSRLGLGFGGGGDADEVTAGRLDEIWAPLMPEVIKSPPWGNGVGGLMWSRAMKMEEMMFVGHPHNAYIQVYLDLGAIGTVCLLGFWIYSWFQFRKLAKDVRIAPELQGFFEGASAGIVSFLIAGNAGSSLMPVPEQSFLWLALGLMWGVQRHLKRLGTK